MHHAQHGEYFDRILHQSRSFGTDLGVDFARNLCKCVAVSKG